MGMVQINLSKYLRIGLTPLIALLLMPEYVSGQVLISPTRVIFDKRTRTASVSMVNSGNKTETYRIEFVERRMKKNGGFEEVKKAKPGELFSSKFIRFSPRQVTLQPGQGQSIRLLLRKPADLAAGEYRSHMLFRAIPKASSNSVNKNTQDGSVSIEITPIIGISIPVIVRHGQVSASIKFNKLRYFAKTSRVLFDLTREGNASVYGDITLLFKDQSGQTTILRKIKGLAVYTPNASRHISVDVEPPGGIKIKNGTLIALFHKTKKAGGQLISEHSVKIP